MEKTVKPLSVEDISWRCDPRKFTFSTTKEVELLKDVIGQDRAVRSLDFGLGLADSGYNIFVLGESGTGKTSIIKARLEEKAAKEKTPDDLCYVHNFSDPDKPRALNLPPGTGRVIRDDMEELVGSLKRDIPKVFESKDYEKHRDEIIEGQQERTRMLFHRLEQKAMEKGCMLKKTVSGLTVVPAKDGKAMGQEEFNALPREKKAEMEERMKLLQERLSDAVREARSIDKETQERITALDREVVQYVVNPLVNELLDKYREFEAVISYLNDVKENIFENIEDFRPREELQLPMGIKLPKTEPSFERYRVNLLVSNEGTKGAPVVVETNPTYYNLFGRIEYRIQYGIASTDFTLLKAGAIQRANGGYLVVDALDVLKNIFVYDALKKVIKNKEVRIEDVWEQYRLISTSTIKPGPIAVNVKVVMIGEPFLYYLLYNLDPEYRKFFKVKADFDNVLDNTDANVFRYAQFVASRCVEKNLLPFDAAAVARVAEHGVRLASDKGKLTARFGALEDLIMEAGYWAASEGAGTVTDGHVEKALKEKIFRSSKIEEKLRAFIKEDTIMVSTEGSTPGQVNGIAVLDMGDYAFGKPSRITARVSMGDMGVVSIEREAKLSGKIHNKAQMILENFIGERYARDFPLTLSASICFEQLYEEIEGDSATCAELYALFSSLTGLPVNQGIAVTGSMNQKGEVQPVGGINEKIEGFFDVCSSKGAVKGQGVIIPGRNVKNLMLKKEVVDAVKKGFFSIYAIDVIDEGFPILFATSAGERDEKGKFPPGTVNYLAGERLRELAAGLKDFGRKKEKDGEKDKG